MFTTTKHHPTTRGRHGTIAARTSTRSTGAEWRALAWLVRHPLFLLVPAGLLAAAHTWGPVLVPAVLGSLLVTALVWWRAHPPSYDRFIAPRVRSAWRRWTTYRGRRWAGVLADCELTRDTRTGRPLVPRVLRVPAVTPSIDRVTVRMVRGQHLDTFTERAPAVADALGAHRVTTTRVRPGVLALVVERRMPFTTTVPATPIPGRVDEVDLNGLDVGDTETGAPFLLRIRGKHLLVVGRSGSGKGSLLWGPLRAMAPLIRDGLVRLWVIDLKGGHRNRPRGAAVPPLGHHGLGRGRPAHRLPRLDEGPAGVDAQRGRSHLPDHP